MLPSNFVHQGVDKSSRQHLVVRLLLALFLLMALMVVAFWLAFRSG